ncbi:hypothetical protein GIB67_034598 [Kingdonia uniflora]|uniref:Aminotransferase-like plant mobile domain-containing protein n=1 Tax=Kingdonia uniflora TaxID=39325 RepID=A0A7J7MXN7_9MAGN|nr:hypothetical protein GIB67_034598 [Kingdonia uniflora]
MNKEAKVVLYKNYGWSELDIISAFRKFPCILEYSDQNIRAKMSFLIEEVGYKPKDIAVKPVLLGCSLEKVLKPRNVVLNILVSRGLIKKKFPLRSVVCFSKETFIRKYVTGYADVAPDLLQVYNAKAIQNDRKLNLNVIGVLHRADIGVYLRMKDDLRNGFESSSRPRKNASKTTRNSNVEVKRRGNADVTNVWPDQLTDDIDPTPSYDELNRVDILPDGWVHISLGSEEIPCRGSLDKVLKWYRWIVVYPTLKKLVDDMGFAEFCSINAGNSDNRLIHALMERWWPSTHTFHFPCGELGFTPLYFVMLTGISFGRGRELPYNERYFKLEEAEKMFPGITSADIRYDRMEGQNQHKLATMAQVYVIDPSRGKSCFSAKHPEGSIGATDDPRDIGWFMDVAGPNDQRRRIPIPVMQVPYPCPPTYNTNELWHQNQGLRYAAYKDSRQYVDRTTKLEEQLWWRDKIIRETFERLAEMSISYQTKPVVQCTYDESLARG